MLRVIMDITPKNKQKIPPILWWRHRCWRLNKDIPNHSPRWSCRCQRLDTWRSVAFLLPLANSKQVGFQRWRSYPAADVLRNPLGTYIFFFGKVFWRYDCSNGPKWMDQNGWFPMSKLVFFVWYPNFGAKDSHIIDCFSWPFFWGHPNPSSMFMFAI